VESHPPGSLRTGSVDEAVVPLDRDQAAKFAYIRMSDLTFRPLRVLATQEATERTYIES
jgi:hypothetical protein